MICSVHNILQRDGGESPIAVVNVGGDATESRNSRYGRTPQTRACMMGIGYELTRFADGVPGLC
jgi:hypothetical protein